MENKELNQNKQNKLLGLRCRVLLIILCMTICMMVFKQARESLGENLPHSLFDIAQLVFNFVLASIIAVLLVLPQIQKKKELAKTVGMLESEIAEHKKAKDALIQSEKTYRTLLENIPQKIFYKDTDSVYISCNKNYADDLGTTPVDISGKTDFDFYPTDLAQKYKEDDSRVIRSGQSEELEETYLKDGQEFIVQTIKTPIADSEGNIVGVLGIFWDITDRKRTEEELDKYRQRLEELVKRRTNELIAVNHDLTQKITDIKTAEEELQKSESELKSIYENAPMVMLLIDGDRKVIKMNKQAELISQCSVDEAVGLGGGDVLRCINSFEDPKGCGHGLACQDCTIRNAVLSTFQSGEAIYRLEASYPCGDPGNPADMHILVSTTLLSDLQEELVLVCLEDITERKMAEEKLRDRQAEMLHMSRLSTIGEMTSGLAHELNQPLCAMTNYTNACLHRIRLGNIDIDKIAEDMQAAVKQAQRAGGIINGIKNFVRKRQFRKSTVDINELVKELSNLVSVDIRRNNVKFNMEMDENLPMVLADPIQIEQVLLNLMLNGIEAMDDTAVDERVLTIETKYTGDTIQVSVCDTGKGLPDEISEKMFDSFFTTKPKGLGIGLSISSSIIETHNGKLWAEANVKGGAKISFSLPI